MSFCDNLLTILTHVFGWKRGDSKITHDCGTRLIRFFDQSPNFLDDPENEEFFRERARKALGPRPKDNGRPTYWEVASVLQHDRVSAQHAARRNKLLKFNILSISTGIVRSHQFTIIEERDDGAFDCVADLHRNIDMVPAKTLDDFIDVVRDYLLTIDQQSDNKKDVTFESLSKADVEKKLKDVAQGCSDLDLNGVHDWVRNTAKGDDFGNI